jgi:hypothetical protein
MRLFDKSGAGPVRGWPAVVVEHEAADGRRRLAIRVGAARYRELSPAAVDKRSKLLAGAPNGVANTLLAAGYELDYADEG